MNKTYGRINWENYPSDETPLNESNLNKIDVATDEIDNRVITLDTTKATKEEVSTLVQDVTFEEKTGIITITKKNGSKITIDTQMEKIAVNFSYNAETQQIILTLIDGTKQYIDLAALITQYEFLESDTVAFSIDSAGKVSAIVKEASIQEKHLRPNYLADIKVEVAKAQASQSAAAKSESNAKASETAAATSESNAAASATKAQSYATGGTNSRTGEDTDNAKYYSQQSAQSQSAAATSADTASTKAKEAAASAATAKTSADNAAGSANLANEKANSAANSATIAVSNSNAAQQYASNAETSANTAQNYAVADMDSAKYYYEQARRISESFSGALRPMGTVTFANLPVLSEVAGGSMYNISDQFTTTAEFKEGAGNTIPAGANVYKTEDGKWDVLAGTPVTGVKGSAESGYRRGNVNITAENVGAVPLGGNAGSADRAARLGRNGNAGYPMTFNWAGKTGQPSWLWGGENGEDMYVYNPSNFSVNYAASAGNAAKVNGHTVSIDVPSNSKFTDTWRGIQDNLTSTSTAESLSANQGRLLANGSARDSTKIPLTGSTGITGNLTPKNHDEKALGDSTHYWKEAYINNVHGRINGHYVYKDVPSNAIFTDTKGSVASNNGTSSGYAMLTLASGYKILAFHTSAQNYIMTNQYGNMYWAAFEITLPVTGIKYFSSVEITPFATSGLINVSITNYTETKVQGFVFSPLAETKSISFHVTVHGTAQ